jgi:hypothetical protein
MVEPHIPPEERLLASSVQAFNGNRSKRVLFDQLNKNELFR